MPNSMGTLKVRKATGVKGSANARKTLKVQHKTDWQKTKKPSPGPKSKIRGSGCRNNNISKQGSVRPNRDKEAHAREKNSEKMVLERALGCTPQRE